MQGQAPRIEPAQPRFGISIFCETGSPLQAPIALGLSSTFGDESIIGESLHRCAAQLR
jgi:hypothetical protein